MRINVFNLTHTYENPCEIVFPNFKLIIEYEHCESVKRIPQRAKKEYSFKIEDNKEIPFIKDIPEIKGGWECTACIEIEEENLKPSIIYIPEAEKNIIDDFCLFCSYLGGRRVCTSNDKENFIPNVEYDRVINLDNLIDLRTYWSKFNLIQYKKLGTQFYNMILSYESNEMIAMFVYANTSYDVIYSKWHKENMDKYLKHKKSILDNIKQKLANQIKNSLYIKISKILLDILQKENDIEDDFIQDVQKRIGNKLHEKTLYLMKYFLEEMDMYPREDNDEIKQRLILIGKVRNAMIHYGDIYSDKYDRLTRIRISGAICNLIITILQVYFAKEIFQIETYSIKYKSKKIKEFFETGKYNGHNVFKESYEEYRKRLDDFYLSNGY